MIQIIKEESDLFDTSELNTHDLRRIFSEHFVRNHDIGLHITIWSFGYPKGLPIDAYLVLM